MSVLDLARRELLALKAYSSARMESARLPIMLNANESAWPLIDNGLDLHRYPDPQPNALLVKLAALYGVDADQVLIGRGSDEPIDLLTRAFCRAGEDAIVISPPTFGMYAVCANVQGARVIEVPLDRSRGFALDTYRLIGRVLTEEAKLVYVCSPNNPTGARVARSEMLGIVESLAGHALVVIDEAYHEYADVPSMAQELKRFEHLAVLRTFSKAYGLAGARLGVLLANAQVIALLRKLLAPYPLPTASLEALDLALQPEAQNAVRERVALTVAERRRLGLALAELPCVLEVLASDANFLTLRVVDAQAILKRLAERGIAIRDTRKYLGLSDALRISIGTPLENDAVLDALRSVVRVAP